MSLEFLITAFIVVASPGTGVFYTLATGLSRGMHAGLIAAFGCTLGIVPHLVAAITGLASVLHASALAFQVLKYLGVAYLIYLAWTTLKARDALEPDAGPPPRSARQIVTTGVLVNVLNPKLTLFFLAFLPQFVGAGDGLPVLRMLELGLAFMAMTLVVFIGYGAGAATVRGRLASRPGTLDWLRRGFAAAFLLLATRLAVTER